MTTRIGRSATRVGAGSLAATVRTALGSAGRTAVRRTSTTALLWTGSLTLGLADVLYAGLLPGSRHATTRAALWVAVAAGVVFAYTAVRAFVLYRQCRARGITWTGEPLPLRAADSGGLRLAFHGRGADPVRREAELGMVQLEAWLARQDRSLDG